MHNLSQQEKELSAKASEMIGISVVLFFDGGWICEPTNVEYRSVYGHATADSAIYDCAKVNGKSLERFKDSTSDVVCWKGEGF